MRAYHKVGGRPGKPAYRTPSSFKNRAFKTLLLVPRGKVILVPSGKKRAVLIRF